MSTSVLPLNNYDEKELDPSKILAGINGLLLLNSLGRGRPKVKAELCHYDDDDSLEVPSPEMAYILVTHEWFSVKICVYPTLDGASNRMAKKFWCSRMIISRVGDMEKFAGFEQHSVTMLRAGLEFLRGYYFELRKKR